MRSLLDERVRWWEQRLLPLALTVPPVTPSAECRRRIVRRVRRRAAEKGLAGPAATRAGVPGGSTDAPSTDVATSLAARREAREASELPALSRWRAFGIAASLTAAALGVLLASRVGVLTVDGDGQRLTTADAGAGSAAPVVDGVSERAALSLLRDESGQPRFIVEIRRDDSVSITALDREPATGEGSLQLWMADGVSGELRPVGLLPGQPWSSVQLDDVPLIEREPAFAVSVEPPGGSPEAGPTGDVVFQGTIHPIGDGE